MVDLPLPTEPVTRIEPVLITGQQFQAFGQTELIHRPHLRVDDAKNQIDPEPLPNDAGAEPAEVIRVGKVRIAPLVAAVLLRVGQETFRQRGGFVARELRGVRPDRLKSSVQAARCGGAFTPR